LKHKVHKAHKEFHSYSLNRLTFLSVPFVLFVFSLGSLAQPANFTRADSLRGFLFPERTCYDVKFYWLDLKIDPETQSISGANRIDFEVLHDFDSMQIDLFADLNIEGIWGPSEPVKKGERLEFTRELNAVFVKFPQRMRKGQTSSIYVQYRGKPKVSQMPPWDDGFVWKEDSLGNYWVGVACQGTGASVWWPNKDHQSDEPDSMMISVKVPPGYMCISNGRLRGDAEIISTRSDLNKWREFDWFVSYPINNYCVTVNIGKYEHIHDAYIRGPGDTLDLDYYVLPYNAEKAKEHFQQVEPMMKCFENYFGRYPFERDGYKLVETSYAGMEHQSAISYGNKYSNGYYRRSASGHGMKFDYIIIHESAHEWWGNSITTNDIADMWVHEGFGTYSEMLYLECMYDYQTSLEYINASKQHIGNQKSVVGPYGVNRPGADIYHKTALVLNTLRSVIDNDSLWFSIIHGIQDTFKYKTVDGADVINYVKNRAGMDLDYFFEQYFHYPNLPVLEVKLDDGRLRYRWKADVENFKMPVEVTVTPWMYERIYPTMEWREMVVQVSPEEFKVEENKFLIKVSK
jgi:aminopeptidase N